MLMIIIIIIIMGQENEREWSEGRINERGEGKRNDAEKGRELKYDTCNVGR
jgi:hypothetical protein